jgi:hypothetical protein
MKPLSVVVAQSNSKTGESLAKSLYNHFRSVNLVDGVDDLRHAIPRHRADVAIVDLELASVDQVHQLTREFPATTIVCTHRLAETKGAPVVAVTGHELPAFSVPATGHGVPSAGPAGVPTAGLRRAASHGRVPAPAAAAAGVQGQQRRLHERMVRYPDTVVYQPVGWHANVSFQHEPFVCLSCTPPLGSLLNSCSAD